MTAPGSLLSVSDLALTRSAGSWRFELELDQLTLESGAQRALVGPSGCGKSTLLDLLALALEPSRVGYFTLQERRRQRGNHDIAALWRDKPSRLGDVRGRCIGYVLQQGGLLPFLTVRNNILLPATLMGEDAAEFCIALSEALSIHHLLDKRPPALSVGERQRVGIARALIHRPSVIFADEPTASVDTANADNIASLLVKMAEMVGAAMVIATHDLALVERLHLDPLALNMSALPNGTRSQFHG